VILKAYARLGRGLRRPHERHVRLRIASATAGRVLLARDRLGIKPLYYTETPGAIRFASTLQALLAYKDGTGRIDPVALQLT
jgi:asparagine synthase (glutamine-hydrolysing)